MKIEKYKHIIWDWNGTLLDDFWLCLEVLNGQLARRNLLSVTAERYRETFGFPLQAFYEANGFDFSVEGFVATNAEFAEGYKSRQSECGLRDGAIEVLKRNPSMGIGQSILSALYQPTLDASVDQFGIRNLLSTVSGSDNKLHSDKSIRGKTLLSEIGLPLEEILYIGDVVEDYITATEMGIDCVLIPGLQSRERLVATGARVIENLSELHYEEVVA